MAGPFLRTNLTDEGFIRGAARLLKAPMSQAFPTKISDVIALAAAAGPPAVALWDAKGDWEDLGATKTGIQIVRNNAEETFDVDQIQGDIGSAPTNWEMNVGTALAENTLERLSDAWEGGGVTTDTVLTPNEKKLGLGQPDVYDQGRLAVAYQRPSTGLIRLFAFRKTQRMPQESAFTFQKTGEQLTIPMRWRCLADDTVENTDERFGVVFDQVAAA